jgi:large subunit ribosomal protein L18
MPTVKEQARQKRHNRIRKTVTGTAARPRLVVSRSLNDIYAQVIDDEAGKTLAAASSLKIKKGTKSEQAAEVGTAIAKAAKEAKVETVVFDRSGHAYHGRVKALAESARENGLKF